MFSICGSRYPSTTKQAFGLWVAVFSEDFFGLNWFWEFVDFGCFSHCVDWFPCENPAASEDLVGGNLMAEDFTDCTRMDPVGYFGGLCLFEISSFLGGQFCQSYFGSLLLCGCG